jgi:uncharacterized C2H2 Zn-finger protein
MPMAKVYNDNILPFQQEFEGEMIRLEPNEFKIMDHEKAVLFQKKYFPIQKDAGGQQKAESFKRIRVEMIGYAKAEELKKFQCMACNKNFEGKKEYDDHINDFHIDQLADKEEAKKRRKAKGLPEG